MQIYLATTSNVKSAVRSLPSCWNCPHALTGVIAAAPFFLREETPSPQESPARKAELLDQRELEDRIAEANKVLDIFFEDGDNINFRLFARQIVKANFAHMETNRTKFTLLNVASIFLVLGIGLTGVGGFIMLSMILPQ